METVETVAPVATPEQLRPQEQSVALPAGQTAMGMLADQVWGLAINSMLTDPKRPGL